MSIVKTISKNIRKKKFKMSQSMEHFARDWDGTGLKVKIRLPFTGSTKKREVLLAPGEIISTRDKTAQRALENWAPPPIYVDGKVWFLREKMFSSTKDTEHIDFDTIGG